MCCVVNMIHKSEPRSKILEPFVWGQSELPGINLEDEVNLEIICEKTSTMNTNDGKRDKGLWPLKRTSQDDLNAGLSDLKIKQECNGLLLHIKFMKANFQQTFDLFKLFQIYLHISGNAFLSRSGLKQSNTLSLDPDLVSLSSFT